jgi:hypothetical protein
MEKAKPEDVQPKSLPEKEETLSPEELGKVSGGRSGGRDNDPCEGGEFHQA